ncbi:MAG: tetratricopeptide repeat protein [Myxococcota bacterium]
MSLRDWWKGRSGSAPDSERDSGVDSMITAYDERGREVKIDRAVWVKDILLPNIEKAWTDADQLYTQIVQALRDEFTDSIVPAVNHLVELDGDSERALLIQAIVRMKLGDLNGAEVALSTSIHKHGQSGVALTNLAKLQEERGQHEHSRETLRRALEQDPNQDNALLWWAALARERGGDEAYRAALAEIGAVRGAWRPQLWIARERLLHADVTGALELYDQVLDAAVGEPGVLMMISGDLGNAGALAELVNVALPRYEPERDGPEAGLNIVEALKRLGRIEEARALVRRLQGLNFAPFSERLAQLDHELAAASLPQSHDKEPEIAALVLRAPLWTRGFSDPEWLWPARPASAPRISFVPLSDASKQGETVESHVVDQAGRVTRALPLYLAEVFHARFDVNASCLVFVAKGHGPVVFRGDNEPASLAHLVPASEGPRVLVTGSVGARGVALKLWDLDAQSSLGEIELDGALEDLGALAEGLETRIGSLLEARGWLRSAPPPEYYRLPMASLRGAYIAAVEQLLYQVLAANELVPPESLWNERGMFESYMALADAFGAPACNADLFAISGVTAASQYGSPVREPYQRIVLEWLERAEPGSLLDRLAPAVYKRLNEEARLASWLQRAQPSPDSAYAAWLARIQAS